MHLSENVLAGLVFNIDEIYTATVKALTTKHKALLMAYNFDMTAMDVLDKIVLEVIIKNLAKNSGIVGSELFVANREPNALIFQEIAQDLTSCGDAINLLVIRHLTTILDYDFIVVKYPGVLWLGWYRRDI